MRTYITWRSWSRIHEALDMPCRSRDFVSQHSRRVSGRVSRLDCGSPAASGKLNRYSPGCAFYRFLGTLFLPFILPSSVQPVAQLVRSDYYLCLIVSILNGAYQIYPVHPLFSMLLIRTICQEANYCAELMKDFLAKNRIHQIFSPRHCLGCFLMRIIFTSRRITAMN
jgi:hypothetical protein